MTIIDHKDIKLSTKVQQILFSRGYSHIFNWEDYKTYKQLTKGAIFQASDIAERFISESCEISDFADYEF